MKRYSKKREAIKNCIASTKEHPSAEWVYNKLKNDFPDLSLGTVYRNINELKEEGVISSVGTVHDKERFDGNVIPHAHAVCKVCGTVVDLSDMDVPTELIKSAEGQSGFEISVGTLNFVGVCPNCRKTQKIDK